MNLSKYFMKKQDSRANRLQRFEIEPAGDRSRLLLGCCPDVLRAIEVMLAGRNCENIGEDENWPARLECDAQPAPELDACLKLLGEVLTLTGAEGLDSAFALDYYTWPVSEGSDVLAATEMGRLIPLGKKGNAGARRTIVRQMVSVVKRHPRLSECNAVIPVPGTDHKLSALLAEEVAEKLTIPSGETAWTGTSAKGPAKRGHESNELKPCTIDDEIDGLSVLVVDDVWHTGISLRSVAHQALADGAVSVFGLVAARNIRR